MKLYGFAISNFYNIVKLGLLEKQFEFEEIPTPPSNQAELLAHSPMGKIPFFQHGNCFLSESQAILFYLELLKPNPRLYPVEPERGARAQQIHQFIDLYVDPEARVLLNAMRNPEQVDNAQIKTCCERLVYNIQALSQLVEFAPFIAGEKLSHADLAAFMTLNFAQSMMQRFSDQDPLARLSGVGAYMDMMEQRDSCQRVLADQQQALANWL
ncbi:glutathione S-transferase family protein [Motiliproteus coralliicola]|uniref:Glutathione S-transferase family protein n=1 Tax=Motiliproteus coralliicola TaxID=2283196 RepID=A0A369WER9_9GAMM|nr:glutathione S-transferase family protein [Motiliproteus coralliicola]RDE19659.1 glutathione S-transferase family protein [Motiliproteus coralliicola]